MRKNSKIKNFLTLKTIGSKLILTCLLDCVILCVALSIVLNGTFNKIEQESMMTKMESDMIHMEDIIGQCEDGEWHIEDGALYRGDVLIGDGTEENANLEPFLETEEKTGTFCYAFIALEDADRGWSGEGSSAYENGRYLRVAGSTKSPTGESIVGTYMDKKVADILDAEGTYSGEANVAGGQIYCLYKQFINNEGEVVGALVVGRSISSLQQMAASAGRQVLFWLILIIVLAGIAVVVVSSRWASAVEKVEHYLNRIGKGELPEEKLQLNTKDEIAMVADSVNDMVESLRDKERIGAELNVATDIQANLLPKIFPAFPRRKDFDLFASMNPAKEVGGDFYDFFMIDDYHIALIIADVSGKGVPAALFMVTAKTLIKDHAQAGVSAGDVFTKANRILCEGNDAGLFVTGWIGILDLATGIMDVANAGHNPPLICHDGEYEYSKLKPGFVLAGMEGIKYKSQQVQLMEGDTLFLYTDGVTEATNIKNELYGEDRLKAFLNSHAGSSVMEICRAVKKDVDDFTGEAPQFDDVTMLAFRYMGGGNEMYEYETEALIENIPVVTQFIEEKLEYFECPMKVITQIDVAVDEIMSNIALYAYKGNVGFVRVNIEKSSDPDRVEVTFTDGGMPYNPLEQEAPDTTLSAEDRKIGGLGIFIVRKTMDDVVYKYENDQNQLKLIKNI